MKPFITRTEGFFAHVLRTSAGSLSPRPRWRNWRPTSSTCRPWPYVPPVSKNGNGASENSPSAVIVGWERSSRALRAAMLKLFEKSKLDTGEEY